MNVHEGLDEEWRDRASAYVLGALDDREAREYSSHLERCAACRREVDDVTRVQMELGRASSVAPDPSLWDRVLARVRNADHDADPGETAATKPDHVERWARSPQIWKQWSEPTERERTLLAFVGGQEGAFEPTGLPGVEAKSLHVDRANDRATFLVRMVAGSSYPAHVHGGPEECYVLQGDLRVGGLHMRAGDYQHAERGSRHGTQTTDGGCLLLLVSSLRDEIVT